MNKRIVSILMILCIVTFSSTTVIGDTATEYENSHSNVMLTGQGLTNRSVLYDFFTSDERVEDLMWETFDDSTYEYIDGTTAAWKAGASSSATGTAWSNDDNCFGSGCLFVNSTDSVTTYNPSAKASSGIWVNNGTVTNGVHTIEFDFLLDLDTEPISILTNILGFVVVLNLSVTTTNMSAHISQGVDHGGYFNYNVTPGEWNHAIISVVNDIVNGFNCTIFINGVSVSLGMAKQTLSTTADVSLWFYQDGDTTSNDLGRDLLFDNLIMINGSFTEEEIWRALTGSYQTQVIIDMIPVIITISVFGMIMAVVKRIKA